MQTESLSVLLVHLRLGPRLASPEGQLSVDSQYVDTDVVLKQSPGKVQ